MRKALLVILCGLNFLSAYPQASPGNIKTYGEINFIIHLSRHKLFDEAEKEKARLFANDSLDPLYKDSVNYFMGMEYYNEKRFAQARDAFLQVSDQVFFYYRAHYLAGIIDAENNRADSAISNYSAIEESTNEDLNELKQFEIAGMHLLQGRYKLFDSLAKNYQFKNQLLKTEFANLEQYSITGKKIKRKSPFIAGALSTVIPGLGKVYAGNNGQALASFLTCGLMEVVAIENYLNFGIRHPQTIFFTGVFGVFYIGNIWGSAVSVQLIKTEKQLENKHNILVGLKLPVHKF